MHALLDASEGAKSRGERTVIQNARITRAVRLTLLVVNSLYVDSQIRESTIWHRTPQGFL